MCSEIINYGEPQKVTWFFFLYLTMFCNMIRFVVVFLARLFSEFWYKSTTNSSLDQHVVCLITYKLNLWILISTCDFFLLQISVALCLNTITKYSSKKIGCSNCPIRFDYCLFFVKWYIYFALAGRFIKPEFTMTTTTTKTSCDLSIINYNVLPVVSCEWVCTEIVSGRRGPVLIEAAVFQRRCHHTLSRCRTGLCVFVSRSFAVHFNFRFHKVLDFLYRKKYKDGSIDKIFHKESRIVSSLKLKRTAWFTVGFFFFSNE